MNDKLEIGPSAEWGRLGSDWDTMDNERFEYVDIVHDIQNIPTPIKDGRYKLVYMSNVIEHIHWQKTAEVLKELFRILEDGGTLEMWTPDFNKIVAATINFNAVPQRERTTSQFEWVNQKIFTYRHDPGKGGQLHESIFNPEWLGGFMVQVGFKDVAPIETPRGPFPWYHGWCQFGLKGNK
jgi:ubiquinone/menaquinone biosynthesis C-methylase UbiE